MFVQPRIPCFFSRFEVTADDGERAEGRGLYCCRGVDGHVVRHNQTMKRLFCRHHDRHLWGMPPVRILAPAQPTKAWQGIEPGADCRTVLPGTEGLPPPGAQICPRGSAFPRQTGIEDCLDPVQAELLAEQLRPLTQVRPGTRTRLFLTPEADAWMDHWYRTAHAKGHLDFHDSTLRSLERRQILGLKLASLGGMP